MTQEEQIRLYRLMEKLNWFFHQELHYLDRETAEKTARECYPEIREFTYDILWNDLPKEMCIRDRVCYVIWGKASAKSGQKVVETAPEELKERYRQIFIPVTENMEQRGGLL